MFNEFDSDSDNPSLRLHYSEPSEDDFIRQINTPSPTYGVTEPQAKLDGLTYPQEAEEEPTDLLARFTHHPLEKRKATNAPKHLLRVLLREMKKLRGSSRTLDAHLDSLESFKSLLGKQCKNRMHLIKVFGLGESDLEKQRNDLNRKIVQRKLAEGKLEDILLNNMIPPKNKLHYLFLCKVYEWRLSDPELVTRFQS